VLSPVAPQRAPLAENNNSREMGGAGHAQITGRRGNTADALNQAKMSIEERKENRMMMGQVVINSGKGGVGGPRF